MDSKNSKYNIGDFFVKTDTGCIYKIIKATWIDVIKNQPGFYIKKDWLYDCETVFGDDRKYVRYYQKRIDEKFYQVPNDSEAIIKLYGS